MRRGERRVFQTQGMAGVSDLLCEEGSRAQNTAPVADISYTL